MVTFQGVIVIEISEIRNCYGSVPDGFAVCMSCKAPAEILVCANWDQARDEQPYKDQEMEALAQEIRAELGTNLELPICRQHFKRSQVNN